MGLKRIKRVIRRKPETVPEAVPVEPVPILDPEPAPLQKVTLPDDVMAAAREACTGTPPHSGRPLWVLAHAAANAPRPEGYPEEYDLLQTAFDHAHYFGQRPDVARARLNPVAHYMRAGQNERVDPVPWFSGARWIAMVEDLGGMTPFGHWLTHGDGDRAEVSPVGYAVENSPAVGLDAETYSESVLAQQADIRERLSVGILGEMVTKAAVFDPLIAQTWTEMTAAKIQPAHDARATGKMGAFRRVHDAAQGRRADAVVLVGDPRWGASRRMEGHIAHALSQLPGLERIAIISTDKPGAVAAAKVPAGGCHIDLADATTGLNHPDRRRVLSETLRALRPRVAFAVNSRLTWEMLGDFGHPLSRTVPIYGCMFCNDKDMMGRWGGYPATRFYRHFEDLAGICTDSHALKAELIETYLVPEEKQDRIVVLSAPVPADIPARTALPDREPEQRPQVFWAGRLDPQKRLDIAYEVARQMPDVDFRFWGRPVAGGVDPKAHRPDNVRLMGSYAAFDELPMEEADAWLYTSEWDGVPQILLEAAMTGVPIVGSAVGGTPEVLLKEGAWSVAPFEDVAAYVAGLREVLSNPEAAYVQALNLRETLIQTRTDAAYQDLLAALVKEARHG